MPTDYPFLLAGEWNNGKACYEIRSPYNLNPIAMVSRAGPAELEQAIQSAVCGFEETRKLPSYQRATILRGVAQKLTEQAEDMARTIAQEAAKPIKQARAEVQRAIFTFAYAAEETTRISGEVLSMDAAPVGEGRQGLVRRFPLGPIAAITPFNFPLNLVAHKLAPAIAAGCSIVLKPATSTPISALKLAKMILEAGFPAHALSVLPMANTDAAPLVEDERFKLLTFTGSPVVGWDMKRRAGRKRVTLELGGNAGVIVHNDADIMQATSRIVTGGFSYAGQSCISVQRVFVAHQVYQKFMCLFIPQVQALKMGDPMDETTDLSALISPTESNRVQEWIAEAQSSGAEIATGGQVRDTMVEPTVLIHVNQDMRVCKEEIFAPVVTVHPYETFDEALALVNQSDFGLQAGIFTNDLRLAWQAYETLEVGGVIINDVPTWRVDHMPYGGVKQSGFGREGIRYAIEEMTELRLLVMNMS